MTTKPISSLLSSFNTNNTENSVIKTDVKVKRVQKKFAFSRKEEEFSSPKSPFLRKRTFEQTSDQKNPSTSSHVKRCCTAEPQSPLPNRNMVHIIPATPRKQMSNLYERAVAYQSPVNNNPALARASFSQSFAPTLTLGTDNISALKTATGYAFKNISYRLPSGRIVCAVQQPIQEKPTCGPGVVLMIALDVVQNMRQVADNARFWGWYGGTRLSNAESLTNGLKCLELPFKITKFVNNKDYVPTEDAQQIEHKLADSAVAIADIKATLASTQNSVILSITHPILKGHWIIVDGFQDGNAWIRDPYLGEAFAVPETSLSRWLMDNEMIQEMISFPQN